MTWVLTLGPRARVGGVLAFDYAPYAWLMALPGGLAMRVAPRFWFWSVLALSIVAATGIAALQRRSPRGALAAGVLIAGLGLADGWPREMPVAGLPRDAASALPSVAPDAPVLELPIGRWGDDVAAMWRGIRLGRRVVNGYSGYDPAHYRVLTTALEEDDPDVLRVLAESSGLVVAVDRTRAGADAAADLARRAGARPVSDAAAWAVFELATRQVPTAPHAQSLAPMRVMASDGEDVTALVTDDDRYTAWHSDVPAAAETALVVELPAVRDVAGIEIGQGVFPAEYPKRLRVEARTPSGWVRVFEGGTAGLALRAVLAAPTSPRLRVSLSGVTTQTLRLVLAEPQAKRYWSVASIAVLVR